MFRIYHPTICYHLLVLFSSSQKKKKKKKIPHLWKILLSLNRQTKAISYYTYIRLTILDHDGELRDNYICIIIWQFHFLMINSEKLREGIRRKQFRTSYRNVHRPAQVWIEILVTAGGASKPYTVAVHTVHTVQKIRYKKSAQNHPWTIKKKKWKIL